MKLLVQYYNEKKNKEVSTSRNEDRAFPERSSYFANWEIIPTQPRSNGKLVSLKKVPYVSRINRN